MDENENATEVLAVTLQQWQQERQLKGLVAAAPVAPVSTVVGCAAVLVGLWPVVPHTSLTMWCNVGLVVVALQLLMWRAFDDQLAVPAAQRSGHVCRRWFLTGSVATGVYWCAAGMLLLPHAPASHQIFLLAAVIAVTAVWLPFFALQRSALATVAAPALLPMSFDLLHASSPALMIMGSVLLLSFAVLVAVTLAIRRLFDVDSAAQQVLYHRATHDSLVGLVNRGEFHRRMQQIDAASMDAYAVVIIDLDRFKEINDSAGHAEGDRVLREVGGIVRQEIRKADTGARIGGDEFAILMQLCTAREAVRVARTILNRINRLRWHAGDESFRVGASIGIACSFDLVPGGSVLEAADHACYSAKTAGRNRIRTAALPVSNLGRPARKRDTESDAGHRPPFLMQYASTACGHDDGWHSRCVTTHQSHGQ